MESRQELSPAAFGGIVLLVVAVVVATPLVVRQARPPQPEQLPVVEPPPPPPEPEPEPEQEPRTPEVLRGKVTWDAERGWITVQDSSGKVVVPAGDLQAVEPLPGGREELLLLRDGRRIQVPVGWVAELPREVRYRFDYERVGNVDPSAPVPQGGE